MSCVSRHIRDMPDTDRDALARRAADGDSAALQHLLMHYHAVLERKLAAQADTRLKPVIDLDDVLQDAYCGVFDHFAGQSAADGGDSATSGTAAFPNAAAFYKWLERVALNQLRDAERFWKKGKRDFRRRAPDVRDTSYDDLIARVARDDSTPSRKLARHEAAAALLTSLARLRPNERAVIRLRFLEGLSAADIAEQMGKSDTAVYSLCHRGLKTLRGLMGAV